jgi:hypothetical protein
MRDWRYYWNHADQVFGDEPLRQVGKTVSGQTRSRRLSARSTSDCY